MRPRLRWYSHFWRAVFAVFVVALGLLNLTAERVAYEGLNPNVKLSALDRYQRLVLAGSIFPLDKNLRWIAETFAKDYNDIVIRNAREQNDAAAQ